MTSWTWDYAPAGTVVSTEFVTPGGEFIDDFFDDVLDKLDTDAVLRDWLAAPGSGGAVTTQDIHYQEFNLANTMVQEAGEQGHLGIIPDTSNIFPDQTLSMDQANMDNFGTSIACESDPMPAQEDHDQQGHSIETIDDFDTTGVLDELEAITSGQYDVTGITQGGIMASTHPNMVALHPTQANALPANYYSCTAPNMMGTVAASQHNAMKQAGSAFPQQYGSNNFYPYGTSTVDNGPMSSYVSTSMEHTGAPFVNMAGGHFISAPMSQISTPPSHRAAAGLAQGFVTPINQIDRPNANRSDTTSSGNSQNLCRYKDASPMAQAVPGATSHFISLPATVCQTHPSHQQIKGKSSSATKPDSRSPANNSSASGSGPETNSSPPIYLPGQLGTVDGLAQVGGSSSSSSSAKKSISPSAKSATTMPAITQSTGERNSCPSVLSSPVQVPADTATQQGTAIKSPASIPRPSFVPDIVQLMEPTAYNIDTETKYSSVTEAREANRASSGLQTNDILPTTDLQKRAIVKALTNAMLSTDNAEDNPGMVKPFKEGKFGSERVEAVCWELLESVIIRHTSGSLLACYGVKRKGTGDSMGFYERITRILQCLATQKTICKHLLDPLYMHQFVDDPVSAYKRVIANKTLNKRKGEVMNAGKQVLGAKKTNGPTAQSQEVKTEEPNSGVSMTPTNTPGSITTHGRNIPATPTGAMRQPSTNVTPQPGNHMFPVPMGAGPLAQLGQARVSPSLGRMATTRAHANRMMGPTSHPRQNIGFHPMTPNSGPPSAHVKPLDTLYNPEQMLGGLIQRNVTNPNVNPNMNPGMNPGVNANANPNMMHANMMNANAQARQLQQAAGAAKGVRKRTLSDTDFEGQGSSAKRQH
ncbi:hypothetical protein BO78DRAFT_446620 [Aspergillus sclerotiicarbonarius CBS 121057]|uniref:Uncharacterized protein n=1 Tax=Aspergillus sclerotiicarbonarius (strain CBS 121057 / IBT 28362) TaxID=1448318 RepID=A0A319EPE1_ASPSB|nr:hypothetical protein BO78DRAFT_446620 [Aspergillus sclerotiicarbonarius CBS 121057]